MQRLEGELADARAQHASTRLALYSTKQAAAEQERRQAASKARVQQLQVSMCCYPRGRGRSALLLKHSWAGSSGL